MTLKKAMCSIARKNQWRESTSLFFVAKSIWSLDECYK